MKPKFCRPNSEIEPNEKSWVNKGREFAGEISQFCRHSDTFIRHIVKPNRRLLSETSDL